jgi:hypothetical protein
MRCFLILCGILLSVIVSGQDFVVTIQGDTLVGEVKPLTYGPEKKVQITEPGKKKVVYSFYKVKSFTFDNEVYQPVKGPQGYTFMKLVKAGYLSLYSFQSNNQNLYDGEYLLKMDGNGIEVPNITFKKGMKRFLDDCPTVADKIDSDVLNKKDLLQIVEEYNSCISNAAANKPPVAESNPAVVVPAGVLDSWNALESKVRSQSNFSEKENALDMIAEIKNKISTSQKVPNFLIDGLKNSLPQEEFKAELDAALQTLK